MNLIKGLVLGATFLVVSTSAFQKSDVLVPLSRTNLTSAEIATYVPEAKMLFVVGEANSMEVVDLTDAKHPVRKSAFSLDGEATSVTSHGNVLAASLLAEPDWEIGFVELMKFENGKVRKVTSVKTCYHPDMVTFTPDGKKILVACEGEQGDSKVDLPGAVAVIDLEKGLEKPEVSIIPFDDPSIEPEYITVSKDSKIAWVSLQENNALARIDVENHRLESIFDLGYVDHSKPGFGLDAVKDKKIKIVNENMWGLRQPDGIKAFEVAGKHYVLTANEGADVENMEAFYGLKGVSASAKKAGKTARFGSRSISLFDGDNGSLLWDSGETFERTFAEVAPEYFNWNSKKGKKSVDARSDDMGCEPENVTVGMVKDASDKERRLVFVGLERMSGVAVFDFTDVNAPKLIDYLMDPQDRGPEGMIFISAEESPLPGTALLVVGYEYSKTLVVYQVSSKIAK